MPDGGAALALWRGLAVAGMLGAAGTAWFGIVVAPAAWLGGADRCRTEGAVRACGLASLALLVVALGLWTGTQTAAMADADGLGATLRAVPAVLRFTRYGHLTVAQLVCGGGLLVLFAQPGNPARWGVAIGGTVLLVLQALRTHAGVMGGAGLLVSELAHLFAAAAWLGALPALLATLRVAPPAAALRLARRFGGYGAVWVAVLAASIVGQFAYLIGGLPGLFGTGYGRVALVKLGLLVVLVGFAAVNRTRLTPALGAGGAAATRRLAVSIVLEAVVGLGVVLAAGWLAQLTPAVHDRPVWPFAWRPSLVSVREDTDVAWEVGWALACIGCGCLMTLVAVARRDAGRWGLIAGGVVLGGIAAPHLAPLLVPANPYSYAVSPAGFTAISILRGEALYPTQCASCHGGGGHGDGPGAAGLPVPPADLTAPHLWAHADGELFWWLAHGIVAPDGRIAMPGFSNVLSEDDRWALIDFIRARNAGGGVTDGWALPVPAPDFSVVCAGAGTLLGLRGGAVLLTFGPRQPDAPAGVRVVWVDPSARPAAGVCAAADPAVGAAYDVVSGGRAGGGARILVDGAGWLRMVRPHGWPDPAALNAAIAAVAARPLVAARASMVGMRM